MNSNDPLGLGANEKERRPMPGHLRRDSRRPFSSFWYSQYQEPMECFHSLGMFDDLFCNSSIAFEESLKEEPLDKPPSKSMSIGITGVPSLMY